MFTKCLVTLSLILAASAKPQLLLQSWPYAAGYGSYSAAYTAPPAVAPQYVAPQYVAPQYVAQQYVAQPYVASLPSYLPSTYVSPYAPSAAVVAQGGLTYPYSSSYYASSSQSQVQVQDYTLQPAVAPAPVPPAVQAAYTLPAYEIVYGR